MEWGDKEQWLLDVSAKKNFPIPSAIINKPILRTDLIVVWEAFNVLDSTRQIGFGSAQPITLAEIQSYLTLYALDVNIAEFVLYLKYLDRVYLNKVSENDNSSTDRR